MAKQRPPMGGTGRRCQSDPVLGSFTAEQDGKTGGDTTNEASMHDEGRVCVQLTMRRLTENKTQRERERAALEVSAPGCAGGMHTQLIVAAAVGGAGGPCDLRGRGGAVQATPPLLVPGAPRAHLRVVRDGVRSPQRPCATDGLKPAPRGGGEESHRRAAQNRTPANRSGAQLPSDDGPRPGER